MKEKLVMFAQHKIAFLFILLFAASPISGFAQTALKDESEAEKLARLFSRRLQQTKDIAPLLHELFAENFLESYLNGSKDDPFLFIKRDVALKVNRDELRRSYVAWLNWLYLSDLYVFSKYSSKSDKLSELSVETMYPPNVWRVFTNNPFISALMKGKLSDDASMIRNVEQLRSVTDTYEKAVMLLRKYVKRNGARPTRQYRETLADWSKRFSLFDPWTSTCDEDCYGLPPNSKLIMVNVPSFQMNLARIDGRIKIVMVSPYVD